MKILIIGGGNMGKTYAEAFLTNRLVSPENLFVLEKHKERIDFLRGEKFLKVFPEIQPEIFAVDLIILAVKPQDSGDLFKQILPYMADNQLVLTIMAGVKIQTIKDAFPKAKVVRAMPNLPAQIAMGMTGFTADSSVNKEDLFMVQNLLNTTGKSLFFEEESMIDAVTAISGSGPAYVFYFLDSMIQTAKKMGFSENQAEVLVEQTFMGAIHLLQSHNLTCAEWIGKVSSKGGTTEAAMKSFEADKLNELIGKGLIAAQNRAIELGN